jgi:hypothetical protein
MGKISNWLKSIGIKSSQALENDAQELSGPIRRSSSYLKDYESWYKDRKYQAIDDEVYESYRKRLHNILSSLNLFVYRSPQANGFYFTYEERFGPEEYSFYFDSLRDRVLALGYSLYHSNREFKNKPNHVEKTETHYLKPIQTKEQMQTNIADQKYGNVIIDLVFVNNDPSYLKVMVNVYSDSLYTEALPFSAFMEQVFLP